MKILNPIYDQAFKYLMENIPTAKKIISVIIEDDITDLEIKTIETTIEDPTRYLRILRMDFKAQIQTITGVKTVLIELQKCEHPTDIIRFRRYLGKSYAGISDSKKKKKKRKKEIITAYPIIAIYFLGYNIPGINTPGVLVDNLIIDSISKQPIKVKSEFIELLNHKSYIIQIERLRKERKTRLEKLLSLFDQSRMTNDKYILDVDVDAEFLDIAEHLQKVIMDDEFRRKLELQEEVDILFYSVERDLLKAKEEILKKDKTIEDKDKTIEDKDKALEDKNKTIIDKDKTIIDKDKRLAEMQRIINELKKKK